MKKQDLKEFRKKPLADLKKTLKEKREKLNELEFDFSTGKIQNVKDVKKLKKDIAQILTIINQDKKNA
ncbi:MAG TPA: 50S ribosomal protein L29 [Candidatus Paceibacterota bacterium]|nr:50S ribosomal protein L29 [Candidatus Paceibacterota bacterium]